MEGNDIFAQQLRSDFCDACGQSNKLLQVNHQLGVAGLPYFWTTYKTYHVGSLDYLLPERPNSELPKACPL